MSFETDIGQGESPSSRVFAGVGVLAAAVSLVRGAGVPGTAGVGFFERTGVATGSALLALGGWGAGPPMLLSNCVH